MSETSPRAFGARLAGAMRLDATLYEEVEHDPGALGQAAAVVALGGLAEGLALTGMLGASGLVAGVVAGFVGWLLATAIVWLIGVRLMRHTSDFPELARTLGFASAPRLLFAIGVLPIGPLLPMLRLVVALATMGTFVIAVRQALDVSTGRALGVCLLAVLVLMTLGRILAAPGTVGG